MATKRFLKDALGWGFALWLIGYALGIVLFFFMPMTTIGWIIMPVGAVLTLIVLLTRGKDHSFLYYLGLGLTWTLLAVVFDYFFLVKTFKPADGYYKLDVYVYYVSTFILPILVGLLKHSGSHERVVHAS